MSSNRRFHTDSRLSENFTERGLASLTGQDPSEWDRYILKELMDNALEAVEEDSTNPNIGVHINNSESEFGSKPVELIVRDNGSGISENRVKKIFKDVDKFGGTKRHYNLPTRGNIGNALMTILGIEGLQNNPLVVETSGKKYVITTNMDTISDIPEIDIDLEDSSIDGTKIVADISELEGNQERLEETLASFIALNPHVNFSIEIDASKKDLDRTETYPAVSRYTGEKFNLSKRATTGKANWFSFDDFKERLKADARVDRDMTVDDFVKEFSKLTSKNKRERVLSGVEIKSDTTIYEIVNNGDEKVKKLHESMIKETKKFNSDNLDSTLGNIGTNLKQGLLNYLDFIGKKEDVEELAKELREEYENINSIKDLVIHYGGGYVAETDEKDIPYYFELAVVPKNDDSNYASSTVKFGINQSVTYSNPEFKFGERIEHVGGKSHRFTHGIGSVFAGSGHGYYVVANLTCPNLTYLDRGKQNFREKPFIDGVSEVVGRAVRKVEREFRSKLNKLWKDETETYERKLANKAPKGFVKNFVFNNFWKAYNEGTDDGRLTIKMRQLFYIMRPWFQEKKERYGYKWSSKSSLGNEKPLELKYGTFSTNIDKYEKEHLGERLIHRDKRGFFVEPHSNEKIDLETTSIKKYSPDLEQFNNLMFVEKAGFFKQIHQDFELTKKYDIGLINARGFNVIAGKNLIEKIQKESDCTLYILSDLDLHGVGIGEKAGEPDALSKFTERFDTERLGLRLQDVKKYDLPIEKKEYSQKELSEIENMVMRGEMTREESEFFKNNQRVEVNALRPTELEQFLTERLEKEGVEKVTPEEEDIEEPDIPDSEEVKKDAINKAVGSWVMDKAGDRITDTIKEEGLDYDDDAENELEKMDDEGKSGIRQKILDKLEDKPPRLWKDIMEDLLEEKEDDAENRKKELDRKIVNTVYDWCEENVDVDMDILAMKEAGRGG